ncbi:transmembrane protein 192 [Gadus macrocephalus]|uniref:transmembrane protein 192 n=1 Tax=Gadus macrocephalus TaxID=80720 RepID=UPI0028CB411E|nr:transmembrane protein 192 [Gadus macrocephalus]
MDSKGSPQYPVSSSVCLDPSTEDDPLVEGPLISPDALHSAIRKEFRTIPTTYSAVLLSLIHVAYVVLSLCVAVMCPLALGEEQECANVLRDVTGQSTIVFGKVCMSVLVLLFAVCVHRHHSRARSRGYLHFYRNTRRLKHLPLAVHSTGNVLLLLVQSSGLSEAISIYMVIAILGIELVVALPCLLIYTVRVARFNRERAVPDVSQEEHCHAYRDAHLTTETGFRDGCGLEEVVEKQADLIEYLKQHNTLLSKRLLNQSAQH